jgi:hypothetical protein
VSCEEGKTGDGLNNTLPGATRADAPSERFESGAA